ncbi:MAG: nickel pincer cofactor biosynthesis protein LarC [Deltaproteobacteria bacterium]|nr:nickel pincer cofactor biosynthesis protein LarC [Deltaproteobacteria bacterium]
MIVLMIDPIGGISGDMLLGSLIHLGCPQEYLEEIYQKLPIGSFDMKTSLRSVSGIRAVDLKFKTGHTHEERRYAQIRDEILAPLPANIRRKAGEIFENLARAEGEIHGVEPEDVHFHEVGAVDSILDIVGIAAALEWFGVEEVYANPAPLGRGTTVSMHGVIPVPAPATVKLLEEMRVRMTDIEAELTTPTGAAVLKTLVKKPFPPSDVVMKRAGYGCGDREIDNWPNLCRVFLCEGQQESADHSCYMVEADVDDMSPEEWEAAFQRIFDAGALDISLTNRVMKKGRPGIGIKAICPSEHLDRVLTGLLTHTTSIGARYYRLSRRVLERKQYMIDTQYGAVRIKEVSLSDGSTRYKAEYRDLHEISLSRNIPLGKVRSEVNRVMEKRTGYDEEKEQ